MERERRERSRVRVRGSMSGRLLTSMSPTPPNKVLTSMIKNPFLASLDDTILSLHVFSLSLCFSCSVNSSLLVITTFSRAIEIDSEHSENCILVFASAISIVYCPPLPRSGFRLARLRRTFEHIRIYAIGRDSFHNQTIMQYSIKSFYNPPSAVS